MKKILHTLVLYLVSNRLEIYSKQATVIIIMRCQRDVLNENEQTKSK